MKLISKFKDFYDSLAHQAREDHPVYLRETKDTYLGRSTGHSHYAAARPDYEQQQQIAKLGKIWDLFVRMPAPTFLEKRIIGFCGRIYLDWSGHQTLEQLEAVVEKYRQEDHAVKTRDNGRKGFRYYHKSWYESFEKAPASKAGKNPRFTKADLKKFLESFDPKIGDEPFLAVGAPVFLIRAYGDDEDFWPKEQQLVINPCLQDLDFPKHLDAYSCFQELDQYLGNNLATQVDIEPRGITDKLKAESHGFNDWSFKRHADEDPKTIKRKKKREEKLAAQLEATTKVPPAPVKEVWLEDLVLEEGGDSVPEDETTNERKTE